MAIQLTVPDYILYEDDVILALNKPCALMVEPDRNGHPNLLQEVKRYIRSTSVAGNDVYAQHIHRLDRPVSGIILFAKKKEVLKNLSEQFAERKVKKYYQALTKSVPLSRNGILEDWLRKEKKRAVIYPYAVEYAEKVRLEYEVHDFRDGLFLWDIELHTGKYHQIRAQLAAIGCPIVGDITYQSAISYKPDSIALHACRLTFNHPVTQERIDITAGHQFNF